MLISTAYIAGLFVARVGARISPVRKGLRRTAKLLRMVHSRSRCSRFQTWLAAHVASPIAWCQCPKMGSTDRSIASTRCRNSGHQWRDQKPSGTCVELRAAADQEADNGYEDFGCSAFFDGGRTAPRTDRGEHSRWARRTTASTRRVWKPVAITSNDCLGCDRNAYRQHDLTIASSSGWLS